MAELLGLNAFIDPADFGKLIARMVMDLLFVALLIRLIYYRMHGRRDFAFSCVLLNVITFSVCMLLRKVPVELGFALGLFAVFGILRYRTEAIGTRELTYLFIVIGLGMVNAVANKKVSLAEVLFINSVVVGTTAWLEYAPLGIRKDSRLILYDNLELLKPGRSAEFLEDLRNRLGLEVTAWHVNDIDFIRDAAQITITCVAAPEIAVEKPAPPGSSPAQGGRSQKTPS